MADEGVCFEPNYFFACLKVVGDLVLQHAAMLAPDDTVHPYFARKESVQDLGVEASRGRFP